MGLSTSAVLPAGTTIDTTPLNTAFASHATEVNRLGGFLPAGSAGAVATNAATALALALRDASGGAQFGGTLAAAAVTGASVALASTSAIVAGYTHRRFSSGTLSSPFVAYAEDGTTVLFQVLYEGSIVASGGQFKNALTQAFAAAQAGTIGLSQTFDASQSANLLQGVVGSTGMYAISPQGDATFKRFLFVGGKTVVGTNGVQLLAIGGMEASATGTDMVHHVALGWYLNSAGLTVPYGGGTVTLASTGVNQYVGVYLDDGGTAHLTAYFPTSAVQFPTSAAKPLYVDFVPASATQFVAALSGTAGQAVIAADLRFLSGGSGGGGGGGMAANAPVVTVGDYTGTNANSRSVSAILAGTASGTTGGVTFGATNQGTNLIAGTQGGNAFLSDALYQSVSPNAINALQASGASLQLTATGGPIFLSTSNSVGGVTTNRMGVISATTTASGTATGAGLYKLVARLPASGAPSLYLTSPATAISTYDISLCVAYWDGGAWQFGSAPNGGLVDWSPIVQPVGGAMLQPTMILGISAGTGTTVNAASYTSAALVASGTLTTAVVTPTVTMRGMVWISCYVSMGSPVATGNALLGVMVNGSFVGQAHFVTDMTASASGTRSFFAPVTLNAGTQYTIGLGAQVTANSYTVNFAQMMGWLFR